ncbi:MAG TPA: DUF6644 family protein [Hyphomicrobiaceae bacterium]|nr:DUF6644 family protein [Hyphomicrobiaceae bacterium]
MNMEAPALLVALEGSAFGDAIRQSVWLYPTANVAHVVGLALFAGAVGVMDLRILGAFAATTPANVIRPARAAAAAALVLMALSGSVLFTAEASHISLNPVFQLKAALVGLGITNALLVGPALRRALSDTPAYVPLPGRVRTAAAVSLAVWLTVAASGRLIAYF